MIKNISIGDLEVEVVKKNIKNLHLAVYPPDGRVRLAAPDTVNDETLRLFTISKLAWIRRQQRKFANQERQSERNYLQRESHYFLGRRYLLRIVQEDDLPYVVVKNKTYLELHVRPGTSKESRASYMEEWYRRELKALIPPLLAKWEKKIGVQIEDWAIRKMKTKWGSCNIEKRKILLNLELVKKTVPCLEYIIVHELVHLLERLHNDRFQAHMDRFLPKWRTYRDELNNLPVSHLNWGY